MLLCITISDKNSIPEDCSVRTHHNIAVLITTTVAADFFPDAVGQV